MRDGKMECIKTKGDNSVRYLEKKSGNYININYIIYIRSQQHMDDDRSQDTRKGS